MRLPSDPDPHYLDLASRILLAGKERVQAAEFSSPDALADAVIDAGCRQLQALDMKAHQGRISSHSIGSEAQVGSMWLQAS
jgi:hypothetical protein